MKEVAAEIVAWAEAGTLAAVAKVVDVQGSGPRAVGAAMALSTEGEVIGSVSGGCVETAVVEQSQAAAASGRARIATFGFSDDEAFSVGLTCGGRLEILITPGAPPAVVEACQAVQAARPIALATVLSEGGQGLGSLGATLAVHPDGTSLGSLGSVGLDHAVVSDALAALRRGGGSTRHYGRDGQALGGEVSVLIEAYTLPPTMVIFGAVDFSAALASSAKLLGYSVVVCDARAAFATRRRFPMADEVVVDWPDRYLASIGGSLGPRDAICVLTHDAKFDLPALVAALNTTVGYIGAMGSRSTHDQRLVRLQKAGVAEGDLDRVMSPIGLDIGARTPEETAISICAEIIAQRSGRPAPSLRDSTGPIHANVPHALAPSP